MNIVKIGNDKQSQRAIQDKNEFEKELREQQKQAEIANKLAEKRSTKAKKAQEASSESVVSGD